MSGASSVVAAISGKVYVGLTTASAPTSSVASLTGFTELGYLNTDGLGFNPDRSTKEIRAFQNSELVREIVTEGKTEYTFSLLESTKASIELFLGSEMVNGKVAFNPVHTGGRKSFVFDVIDGAKGIRHYVPSGEVMKIEGQKFQNGEPVEYAVTISAYMVNGRSVDIFYSEFEV
jgi:hypothetical protein